MGLGEPERADVLKKFDEELAKMSETRRASAAAEGKRWFEFISNPYVGAGEFSEDLAFFWKARQCGFSIWCDTQVRPGHIGEHVFDASQMPSQAEALASGLAKPMTV